MSYLYLIHNKEESQLFPLYKIGIANDVESRLSQLQTGNPYELVIKSCYEFPNAQAVETVLHQRFERVRRRGEWFQLTRNDLDLFNELCVLLGGVDFIPNALVSSEEEVEEAEEIQEAIFTGTDEAKFDYVAMFRDGWRMEKSTSKGVNGRYWCWRKGAEVLGRKYIYGGLITNLPHSLEEMRSIYRDGLVPQVAAPSGSESVLCDAGNPGA